MAGSLKNIGLTSLDDLFKTDEQRQADAQERVQIVPADQVFPYARQPYSIDRPTQDLAQLMDSIERVGIAEPLIVRPRDGGGYEIIAGHRRDYCAKTIGLETRPVIVREYSDEDADILVVDYNIHRDDLLPSEKAKAYKLRLDAMKRKAGRPSKNGVQFEPHFSQGKARDILAEQVDESAAKIQRYIRLNSLIPPLLEKVDNGMLKFIPAAESISYGDFTAVDDLTFEIGEGHVYGFLGPNGAGKSTTMNIMTGCLSATEGQVRIDGYDIFDEPDKAKKLIGYLPEHPPLYMNETPLE